MSKEQEDKIFVGLKLEEIEKSARELSKRLHEIQNPDGPYDFDILKEIANDCRNLNYNGQDIMVRLTGRIR